MPMFGQQLGYLGASSPAEAALQRAVVALGMLTNDARLALRIDGAVGPGTAAAVNRALTAYVTSAPPAARTGNLSVATIRAQAGALTNLIGQEVNRRQANRSKAPVAKAAAAPPANKVAISTLQRAVATLGAQRNDSTLKIATDGAIGPKTVAATNRALTRYVSGAPANMRTGSLNTAQVQSNAALIATYIEREIAAFKSKPAAALTSTRTASKADAMRLQNALRSLGNVTKDAVLKIAADGIIGPRTVTAVNRAFSAYLGKKGQSTQDLIIANIGEYTRLIGNEAVKRGASPAGQATPGAQAAVPGGVANLTVARMQRALIDLGALVGDPVLRIASDGIVGPKTTAAVNKTVASYLPNAPAGLKQRLSPGQVSAMADVIASQVEAAVAAKRAVAAREEAKGGKGAGIEDGHQVPPNSYFGPDGTWHTRGDGGPGDPGVNVPATDTTRYNPDGSFQPDIGPAKQTATVPSEPSYTPSPSEAAYARQTQQTPSDSGGGGGGGGGPSSALAPAPSAEVQLTPGADVPAPAEKKKFPWMWVGIGTGVAVLGGVAIIAFSKKRKRTARRRALVPAHA